jgi:hypothetical protein
MTPEELIPKIQEDITNTFSKGGGIHPYLAILYQGELKEVPVDVLMENKPMLGRVIDKMVKNFDHVFLVTEVWMVAYTPKPAVLIEDYPVPSECDNREEFALIMEYTTPPTMRRAPILRPAKGAPTIGEWIAHAPSEMSGNLVPEGDES